MKFDLVTILIVGIAVLVTIQIDGCLDGKKENTDGYKIELKHLEEDKRELQAENAELKNDKQILRDEMRFKDSINDIKKSTIEIRYKNIPVIINATPVDEVADAAEKRFGQNQ